MKITRRKAVIAVSSVLFFAAAVIAFAYHNRPRSYPAEMSVANGLYNHSPYGVLHPQEKMNSTIEFLDFESSKNVVFCARPNCEHEPVECFTTQLRNKTTHWTLYNEQLYFAIGEFNAELDKTVTYLYEANTDGSRERLITAIDMFPAGVTIICREFLIAEGVILLSFYDQQGSDLANEMTNNWIVAVNIQTGKMKTIWQHTAQGSLIWLQHIKAGMLYVYHHTYADKLPILDRTGDVSDEAERALTDAAVQHTRRNWFGLDIHTGDVIDFGPEYTDMRYQTISEYMKAYYLEDSYCFLTGSIRPGEAFSIVFFDYTTHEEIARYTPVHPVDPVHEFAAYEALDENTLLMINNELEGFGKAGVYVLFDLTTGETTRLTMFDPAVDYPYYARTYTFKMGDKLFFKRYTSADEQDYAWVSVADVLANNAAGIHAFERTK